MPRLTLGRPESHGGPGASASAALDRAPRRPREEGEPAETKPHGVTGELEPIPSDFVQGAGCTLDCSEQTSHGIQGTRRRRKLFFSHKKAWRVFLPAAAVWSVCHQDAPLSPVDVCWTLALLCSLWAAMGGCVYLLLCHLRSPHQRGDKSLRLQEEVVKNELCKPSSRPDVHIPLGLVLADCLLLNVLQEHLPDPSGSHMMDLLSRLECVSNALDTAVLVPEVTSQSRRLTDKVTLIRTYLNKRTRLLRRLVQVQADLEAGMKGLQDGVLVHWARLEDLHTGVTLTRQDGQDHGDLASTCKDAETLFEVVSQHRSQLEGCQDLLKDSTQLLQELTWSHISARKCLSSGGGGGESVWPEVLLQSNMEEFDKVRENFLSLQQQTATFQAHLEGLSARGVEHLAADRLSSSPPLDLNSGRSSEVSSDHWESTTAESDTRQSLCERSVLQVTSTLGRLRKSSRKKKE
ncbi:uncharacterized protein si:ch211-151h10.2 [Nerophis ophidion]|uniref:uncharacterized protein si:ch211-151h10.2 n=1 Tax=Nerophis ophidion TaxID=159077 RepID=UPI002AE048F1|nr:uncharacterized protein si:ch211-151h10.2 [Nerophis ophidion]